MAEHRISEARAWRTREQSRLKSLWPAIPKGPFRVPLLSLHKAFDGGIIARSGAGRHFGGPVEGVIGRRVRAWGIMQRSRSLARDSICRVVLLFAALGLAGCHSVDDLDATIDPSVLTAAAAVYEALSKKRKLNVGDKIDRHRGFFLRRRAEMLGSKHLDWVAPSQGPAYKTLSDQIESDFTAVQSYVDMKIGNGASKGQITDGTDPHSPPHLDLTDLAKVKTTTSVASAKTNAANYRQRRKNRAQNIIWRAAGIETELWDGTTLKQDAFDEILDRRLRAVERMNLQVSEASVLGGGANWNRTGAHGPWKDGFRVRIFEYPRVSLEFKAFVELAHPREWQVAHGRYEYLPTAVRIPPPLDEHWKLDSRSDTSQGYPTILTPQGIGAAEVLDRLYAHRDGDADSRLDWWQRNWMFCDHVMASIHVEALVFGLRRRNGNADDFDAAVVAKSRYVQLDAVFGSDAEDNVLTTDGKYFENSKMSQRDLQIGDHVIFWNSPIYGALVAGDWRLENTLVMDVDSDPKEGGTRINSTSFQGHGVAELTYGNYIAAIGAKMGIREIQDQAAAADSSTKSFLFNRTPIVRWSPLGDNFSAPGAWWARVPILTMTPGDPKIVLAGPALGPSYVPPPALKAGENPESFAYFPLFEPPLPGGSPWKTYFDKRRADPQFKPGRLRPIQIDGSVVPGLYRHFDIQPFPALRPRVLP